MSLRTSMDLSNYLYIFLFPSFRSMDANNSKINKEQNAIVRTVIGELIGTDMTNAFADSLSDPDF